VFWVAIVMLLSSCQGKSPSVSPVGSDRAVVNIQNKAVSLPDPSISKNNKEYFAKALIAAVTQKLIDDKKITSADTEIKQLEGPASTLAVAARGALDPRALEAVDVLVPKEPDPNLNPNPDPNPNQCLANNGAPICVTACSFAEAHAVASASAYGFGIGQCAGGGTAWASAGASAFASASARATACASACSDGSTSTSASFSSSFSYFSSFFGAGGFAR